MSTYGQYASIMDGLKNNSTLEELNLSNNSLTNDHIKQLRTALREHPKIKYINLSYNRFDNDGIEALKQLMRENTKIQKIDIACAFNIFGRFHMLDNLHRG